MSELYVIRTIGEDSLQHYGVLGMKWGRRKATTYSTQMKNAKTKYKKNKKRIDSRYTKAAEKYDAVTSNGSVRNKKAEDAFERAADRWAVQRKTARKNYRNEKRNIKNTYNKKLDKAYDEVTKRSSVYDRYKYNDATRRRAAKYIADYDMPVKKAIEKANKDADRNGTVAEFVAATLGLYSGRRYASSYASYR